MRKDTLAAGARSATFSSNESHVGEEIVINPGMVAPEEIKPEETLSSVEDSYPFIPQPEIFEPLGEVLLVRRAEAKSPSGILLMPETAEKERPAEGEVMAIGPLVKTVNVGDRIVFGKYAGAEFELNGETLLLMEIGDVKGRKTKAKIQADINHTLKILAPMGRHIGEA